MQMEFIAAIGEVFYIYLSLGGLVEPLLQPNDCLDIGLVSRIQYRDGMVDEIV